MRLGIFGGSFDPVHFGHLLLAECSREQCNLDKVLFVPAFVPPHKQDRGLADAKHRIEMLRLAIAGHDSFDVSTIEIDRGGVSYTVDTLAEIAEQHPDATLHLLIGPDSLDELPTWREPRRICELAIPTVARYDNENVDYGVLAPLVAPDRLAEIRRSSVELPAIDFRSTDIRRRIAAGLSIRYRTPRAVETYIATHALYRGNETA